VKSVIIQLKGKFYKEGDVKGIPALFWLPPRTLPPPRPATSL